MARLPYEELGTLADDPELTARVIRRPGEEKLYLLNRVPHGVHSQIGMYNRTPAMPEMFRSPPL